MIGSSRTARSWYDLTGQLQNMAMTRSFLPLHAGIGDDKDLPHVWQPLPGIPVLSAFLTSSRTRPDSAGSSATVGGPGSQARKGIVRFLPSSSA